MMRKRLAAALTAVFVSLASVSCESVFSLTERDTPADIDKAAYDYLVKWDLAYADDNGDGVISDKELSETGCIKLDLTDVEDISWLSRLKKCWLLELKNGSLTDFSVLGDMPVLSNLSMTNVPAEDISFMENLNLEVCELVSMPQITDKMRMEQMRFRDCSVAEGASSVLRYTPQRFANVQIAIADPDTAQFLGGGAKSSANDPRLYGMKAGETTYTVSLDGVDYFTKKITVQNEDVICDPETEDAVCKRYKTAQSTYYNAESDPQIPDSHYSKTVVLVDETLYAIRADKAVPVLTDVADYEYLTLYSDETVFRNDVNCDAVRKTDGTVLANGKQIIEEPCTALRGNMALGESGTLYAIAASVEKGILAEPVADDIECMAEGCPDLFLNKAGCLVCIRTIRYGADPIIRETEIAGLPVSSVSSPLDCYLVDSNGTQYHIGFSDHVPLVNQYTVEMQNTDAERVEYQYDENGRRYLVCCMKDGTVKVLRDMYDNWNTDEIEDMHWGALNLDVSCLFQDAPVDERDPEDRNRLMYYLSGDHELHFYWRGKNIRMSHILCGIPVSSLSEPEYARVWFLRVDGTIWFYDLVKEEWSRAETAEQTASGDLNNDGICDAADAEQLCGFLRGDSSLEGSWTAADMNKDGRLDAADMTWMLRRIYGSGEKQKG